MNNITISSEIDSATREFVNGSINGFHKLERIILLHPENLQARYNYAIMCEKLRLIDKSISNYVFVINKDKKHWQSRLNLALIFINQAKYFESLKYVDQVLKIKKNFQPALREKALIMFYLNNYVDAKNLIDSSIKINNKDYIALNTKSLILMKLGKYEEAKQILLETIEISKNYAPSYNNLGRCLYYLNKFEEALVYYKKTLDLDPKSFHALNNIGGYYLDKGDYKEALNYFFKSLEIYKKNILVINNISKAYLNLGKDNLSKEYSLKAISLDPENLEAKETYAFYLCKHKEYQLAWKHFENRLLKDEFFLKNPYSTNVKSKIWKGEKVEKNEKILIIKEQGVGDEILYASMYKEAINYFSNLEIEADPRLVDIFNCSFKTEKFKNFGTYSNNKKSIKQFDYIIYAFSLTNFFRQSIKSFNGKKYLFANKKKKDSFLKKFNNISNKPKIGISWRSFNKKYGDYKSVPLNLLADILMLDKYTFLNFQYGGGENEIKKFKILKDKIITINDLDIDNDFNSLSAALSNLSLFITASNSTAHLAAALGVRTWLIKPEKKHAAFHYWNQTENKTPWYESIRLYPSDSGFDKTLKKIKLDLIKEIK